MAERFAERGVEVPRWAHGPAAGEKPLLGVEVERTGDDDPAPDRFRVILDTAVRIAELDAVANPADRAPT